MKPRKIPMRMCVGCREMKPKKELMRIVKSPEGVIAWDRVGKAPGRGAYLCHDTACLTRAMKAKQLERALEHSIDEAVYQQLVKELDEDG
ncbi:MAG: YlxR family protein [Clostridia bacterium]